MKKNLYLTIVFVLFSIAFANANTETTLWSENFEGDWTDNWYADAGIWEVGTPTSGPNAAYTGDNCAATVLDGNYLYGPDSRLISSRINLPSIALDEEILLRFQQYFSYSASDKGYVQVQSYDTGTSEWSDWTTLDIFSSYVTSWHHAKVELTAYAGQTIRIGFYHTDVTEDLGGIVHHYESTGWYIDDVEIYKQSIPWFSGFEDFEEGFGDWYSEDGIWQKGKPSSGPGSAYSGTQALATVLNGNYPYGPDSRLISPRINLPSIALDEEILLRFQQYFSYSASDRGDVQIQSYDVGTNEWSNWTTIVSFNAYVTSWYYARVELTAYAGQTIRIGFYHTDVTEDPGGIVHHYESTGWYIDDVKITGLQPINVNDILSYSFGVPPQTSDPTIDATAKTIEVEVEYGTDLTNLTSTFTLSDGATAKVGAIAQVSGTTANDFSGPVTYTVTAEDGTTVQDWEVTVTVAPNTETEIIDFAFGTPPQTSAATIDESAKTIDIEVEYGTDLTNLIPTFTLSNGATAKVGAVAQVSGTTVNDFSNPVTYKVTAEDGTTVQDWEVTVTVAPNTETEIIDFAFGTPPQTGVETINATAKTIDIEVEYGTDLTNLVSTFTLSDGATAKVGTVAQVSGTTANDFSSPVTYTVTAEDGTTVQDWEATVTVAPNTETEIIDFAFGTPPQTGAAIIDATAKTIDIEVEYGTVLTNLVSTFTLSDGATAKIGVVSQVSGTTANDFTSPVTYTVTAEDGTTVQDWEVTATVAPYINNKAEILSFGFGIPPQTANATIDATAKTIAIEVKPGTDVSNLVATFTLSNGASAKIGTVMQTSGTTANDFTNPITYSVTAEDGTTIQDWVVTVTKAAALNDETDMLTFGFGIPPQTGNATISATARTIDIEVEYGTVLTNLIPTFTLSDGATAKVGAVAQVSGTTVNDFSSPVTYKITAEDGTTVQDWTVSVSVAPNDETDIISFSFGIPPQTQNSVINAALHTVQIRVESTTDLSNLAAMFTLSDGATVKVGNTMQISGTSVNDFTNPVTYKVMAEDGSTTQDWMVTVTKAIVLNNETEILTFGFGIPPQTGAATIDAVAKTILIEVEAGTDVTNLVSTITLSDGATAKVGSIIQASGTTANDFTNPVTYKVMAEDGATTQDWVVTVTKAVVLNDETEILAFEFGTPPQTGAATIDAVAKTILIEVEADTDVTKLVSTFTLSEGATAKVGSIIQTSGTTANDFTNPVTYKVMAEDGATTQDWVVTVTKAVVLNDETNILTFGFGTPTQSVDAIITLNSHTIEIMVVAGTDVTNLAPIFTLSNGATAKVGAVVQESGSTTNDFTNPVTYIVTAEDGTTIQEWTVTVTIATRINAISLRQMKIYPNPFYDRTTIEFDNFENSEYNLAIFNMAGIKVLEIKDVTSDKIEIERGNLTAGVYIVELKGAVNYGYKRFVVR